MNRSVRRRPCVGELLKAFLRLLGRSQRSRPICSCVRCHRALSGCQAKLGLTPTSGPGVFAPCRVVYLCGVVCAHMGGLGEKKVTFDTLAVVTSLQ